MSIHVISSFKFFSCEFFKSQGKCKFFFIDTKFCSKIIFLAVVCVLKVSWIKKVTAFFPFPGTVISHFAGRKVFNWKTSFVRKHAMFGKTWLYWPYRKFYKFRWKSFIIFFWNRICFFPDIIWPVINKVIWKKLIFDPHRDYFLFLFAQNKISGTKFPIKINFFYHLKH